MPGMTYTMLYAGRAPAGGLMDLPEDARKMGAPPSWIGYVGVDDVDASAAKAKGLGATVHVPPRDIPEVGRFSVIADPQAAAIALFKPSKPRDQAAAAPGTPGRIGWHELMATDWEKAFAFYAEMFGWQKDRRGGHGPDGHLPALRARAEQAIGGMFNKPPAVPVLLLALLLQRRRHRRGDGTREAGGGEVVNGPMQVPGGGWIVQGKDPQGAMFALFGKRG